MPGVVNQTRQAFQANNRLALLIGTELGALVPVATYVVAHHENPGTLWHVTSPLIAGGLLYSATTVYQWAASAFSSAHKAAGFVVLVEGTMLLSTTPVLAYAALATLVCINAVSTSCNLALEKPTKVRAKPRAKSVPSTRLKVAS